MHKRQPHFSRKELKSMQALHLSPAEYQRRQENVRKLGKTMGEGAKLVKNNAKLAAGLTAAFILGVSVGEKDVPQATHQVERGDATYVMDADDNAWTLAQKVVRARTGSTEGVDLRPLAKEISEANGNVLEAGREIQLSDIPDQDPAQPGIQLDPPKLPEQK